MVQDVDLGEVVITPAKRSVIPTASILVCFNRDVIKEILTTARVGGDVLQATRDAKDAMLFSNVGNPNFEAFEHSLGAGTNSQKMTLTIIDPKQEFEKRFLSDNILRDAVGYFPPLHREQGDIGPRAAPAPLNLTPFEIGEWKTYLKRLYANKFFYFAYGVGLNVDQWAGPHVMKLINADVTIQEARRITLEFAPIERSIRGQDRRGPYGELVDIHMGGLLNTVLGRSGEIDFKEYTDGGTVYERKVGSEEGHRIPAGEGEAGDTDIVDRLDEEKELLSVALTKLGKQRVAGFVETADMHLILTDLIRDYIQKATGNMNVIVLLPNINYIARDFIDDAYKNFETPSTTPAPAPPLPVPFTGTHGPEPEPQPEPPDLTFGQFYKTFHFMLNEFGIQLARVKSREIIPVPEGGMTSDSSEEETTLPSPVTYPWDPAGATPETTSGDFMENWIYRAQRTQSATGRLPNHSAAIFGFTDKLKKIVESVFKINVFYAAETNLDIIQFWSEQKDKARTLYGGIGLEYLFGGNGEFNLSNPVIIFGDKALIANFLYGRINIETYYETVEKLKEKIAVTDAAEELDKKLKEEEAGWNRERARGPRLNPGFEGTAADPGFRFEPELAQVQAQRARLSEVLRTSYRPALIDLAPLHPLDKLILTDGKYNKRINELNLPRTPSVETPFSNSNYITNPEATAILEREDTFGLSELEGVTPQDKLRSLPIFRFNVKNSNILDLNYKYGPIYFGMLKGAYAKAVNRRVSDEVGGKVESRFSGFDFNKLEDVLRYVITMDYANMSDENKQALINDLMLQINPTGESTLDNDALQFATGVIALYSIMTDEQRQQMLFVVNQQLPGQPAPILASFMEDMMKRAHQMNITTLPMCNLSKLTTLLDTCIVIAEDVPITQQIRPERSTLNNFFSGGYRITGFKHTINSREATSTFQLHRSWRKPVLSGREDPFDLGGKSPEEYALNLAWGSE